MNRTYLGDH